MTNSGHSVCVRTSLKGDTTLLDDVVKYLLSFVTTSSEDQSAQLVWYSLIHLVDILVSDAKIDA